MASSLSKNMKITFPDRTALTAVLTAVKDFSEFVRFEFKSMLASAVILDSTHVSVTCVEFVICTDNAEGVAEATFRVQSLLQVLDLGKRDNTVDMIIEPECESVEIVMDDEQVKTRIKVYDDVVEVMDPPDMSGVDMYVVASDLATRVRDLAGFGDTVSLRPVGTGGKLELGVDSDIGTARVAIDTLSVDGDVGTLVGETRLAVRYIVSILKISKLFDRVCVVLAPGLPVCLKMSTDIVSVAFYLAPKFDEDADEEA